MKKSLIGLMCVVLMILCCSCSSSKEPGMENKQKSDEQNETVQTDENSFYLVYGELGEYGKIVKVDSGEYFFYYIPSGIYSAELVEGISITDIYAWIEKNKSNKTEEGYTEYPLAGKLSFKTRGDTVEFTIHDDEHILLVDGVTLKITRKK